jgi:hypothetical protein
MKSEECKLPMEKLADSFAPAGKTAKRIGRPWMTMPRTLHFSIFIFQFSFFTLCASHAYAASDVDVDKPYKVQLVLRFAEHRFLTDAFKDKVERELKDSLQAALGEMGEVEVVHKHLKLKEIEEKGLEQVLDSWRDVTGVKTHFVLIGFKDGEFDIQARQHDGYTGLSSYFRKPEHITDRLLVARTAALLIDRDFGTGGAVEPIDAQTALVRFRGGALEGSLDRWVKKGDVFGLARIDGTPGKEHAVALEGALLQAREEPKDGKCLCNLFQGEAKALPPGQTFRCVKLGTTRAPLRIQIFKRDAPTPRTPAPNLQIHVRKQGFKEDEKPEEGTTDGQGFFSTDQRKLVYDNVAFVSCMVNNRLRAQFPAPIYDQGVKIFRVSVSQDAATQLALDCRLWEERMYEIDLMQVKLFAELLKGDPENRQATLEKAQKGFEALDTDLAQFKRKRDELLERKMDRTAGASRLKDLSEKRDKLKDFVANQEEIIRAENDPSRKEILELVKQAQLLEGDAEFGKALEVYDKVLAKITAAGLKDPKLNDYGKHVDQLKANWAVKGRAHEAARTFIYETWPGLDPEDLKQRGVAEARKALDACRKAGDTLAPQKLAKVALAHQGRLNQKRSELNPDLSTDDVKAAQAIEATLDDLAKLLEEVNDVLKQNTLPK